MWMLDLWLAPVPNRHGWESEPEIVGVYNPYVVPLHGTVLQPVHATDNMPSCDIVLRRKRWEEKGIA